MMVNPISDLIRGDIRRNEPMSLHTSWRTGGTAAYYFIPADLNDLSLYLKQLEGNESRLWLGLGSNLLVRDGGFNGHVLALFHALNRLDIHTDRVYVEAGVACAKVARQATKAGLTGAEFLAGIPGAMGGALAMNAGAFGGETWELVAKLIVMDPAGEIHSLSQSEVQRSYRQVTLAEGYGIIATELQLKVGNVDAAQQRIKSLLAQRAATQPTQTANAGSVFKNPQNDHAARLIEACQLKGHRIGGASVSTKHANFIINDNHATAADIEALILLVQKTVKAQQGVSLEPEVRIVGDRTDG